MSSPYREQTPMACLSDFEKHAVQVVPKMLLEFLRCGANGEETVKENSEAFKRWRIRPRVLRNVASMNLKTSILGTEVDFPVCIAPSCCHKLWHDDGEIATAKGAREMNTIFTLGINTNTRIEEIAEKVPGGLHFFQLSCYAVPNAREFSVNLMQRAEHCGFKAIMFTVDIAAKGERYAIMRSGFNMPKHLRLVEFEDIPGSEKFFRVENDRTFTWQDLKFLRSKTSLPFIVKGILTVEDALLALECGADGIIVSNHGGRQLDTTLATIDVLPEVVSAVNGRCEVYLDGGVRQGTDVFKALALGARAVFIGRPAIYGLAYNGSAGVNKILRILKNELETAMALSGCVSLQDIKREMVIHQEHQWARL